MLESLILLVALGGASYAFFITAQKLYKILMLGKSEFPLDQIPERIKSVLVYVFGQGRVIREPSGWGHFFIFWCFLILVVTYVETIFKGIWSGFSYTLFLNPLKLSFLYGILMFLSEILSVIVIGALGLALFRRYVLKPKRLESDDPHGAVDATIIICLIGTLIISMFADRGIELSLDAESKWAAWMPVSNMISGWWIDVSHQGQEIWHKVLWWLHMAVLLGFLMYIPHSKHLHLLGAIPNVFFRSFKPKGELTSLDLEDENAETFGVSTIEEYTRKQLLDLYACTECGRCQENCPAYLTDKPLSPKRLIHEMKKHLLEKGKVLIEQGIPSAEGEEAAAEGSEAVSPEVLSKALIGDVVKEDEFWSCTTCRACMENCPVFIEHIQSMVDIRRYQVLMESNFPQEVQLVFKNMETNYNPWSMGYASRGDWAKGLEVKTLAEGDEVEVLYWVGCAGSFDDRNKQVSTDLIKIFQKAGVNFGILGAEEMCCGETARRLGNEYLAQTLMQGNVEVLNNYKVKTIVTACPHCFNTLKNEYPQFGGNFKVIHHTEFILELIKNGRLKLKEGVVKKGTIAYHDSCYLGRYNDVYEEPREILRSLRLNVVESKRNHGKSFCCGAGGGRMWMEETLGSRINEVRTEELLNSTGTSLIGTACPYCLTMFDDGVKAKEKEESVQVLDLAEIIAKAL